MEFEIECGRIESRSIFNTGKVFTYQTGFFLDTAHLVGEDDYLYIDGHCNQDIFQVGKKYRLTIEEIE